MICDISWAAFTTENAAYLLNNSYKSSLLYVSQEEGINTASACLKAWDYLQTLRSYLNTDYFNVVLPITELADDTPRKSVDQDLLCQAFTLTATPRQRERLPLYSNIA